MCSTVASHKVPRADIMLDWVDSLALRPFIFIDLAYENRVHQPASHLETPISNDLPSENSLTSSSPFDADFVSAYVTEWYFLSLYLYDIYLLVSFLLLSRIWPVTSQQCADNWVNVTHQALIFVTKSFLIAFLLISAVILKKTTL